MMNKSTLLVSAGIAATLLTTPAFAQQEGCRGNTDLTKFKSYEQGAHVFTARNSDRGRGNGGESFVVDVDALALPEDIIVTLIHRCVKTADEDTGEVGGAHYVVGDDHLEVAPRTDVPEQDPGKGNQ